MKKRLLSALLMGIVVIPLFIIGSWPFKLLVCLITFLSFKEITDLKKYYKEVPTIIKGISIISLCLLLLQGLNSSVIELDISFQILTLILIFQILPSVFYDSDEWSIKDAVFLTCFVIILGISGSVIMSLRDRGVYVLLYLVSIPVLTDTFAFLIGSTFGKTKLCPKLSPKKTWEGSFAGLIACMVGSTLIYAFLVGNFKIEIALMTFILSIIGQFGDLIFSKIKRENDIKDFSDIIPGHGGLLDRVDSLIFVAIAYAMMSMLF